MAQDNYCFQVNLAGMLDILSNHLYKTADVFLRELMQNGVDAVTRRKVIDPDFQQGRLDIELMPGRKLVFTDNGSGLTKTEIHEFLSVIGQSSKQQLENGLIPENYIGRFGIGLLSCFMVSDAIVVETRAFGEEEAHRWTGLPDGTYHIEAIERESTGTSIILEAKTGCEEYFDQEKIGELVRFYGIMLPVPVYLNDLVRPLNQLPGDIRTMGRGQLLAVGEWLFEEDFLDVIPIHTRHLDGAAYVLAYKTDMMVREGHRIFLKRMLLTEQGRPLLPEWSFFLKCFLNTDSLRPTASRENFYEDEVLKEAQQEFSEAVKTYFRRLSVEQPQILQNIVGVHLDAIKNMAVWDDEMFELFIDHLLFETSEGEMSGAQLCRLDSAMFVSEVARFKQLSSLFVAQNRILICTGYMNDDALVRKMVSLRGARFEQLLEENIEGILLELPQEEAAKYEIVIHRLSRALKRFDCKVDLRRFFPVDLPAMYYMSDDVKFLRRVQSAQEGSRGIFSEALASLLAGNEEKPLATLYLNENNTLIQRLLTEQNEKLLQSIIRLLYVQALVVGGQQLHKPELQSFGEELLYLIEAPYAQSGSGMGLPQENGRKAVWDKKGEKDEQKDL